MKNRIALVTAGPTREHWDPVRYLSNRSSGKMGIALAEELEAAGFRVTLVLGPGVSPPAGIHSVSVVSARDMLRETAKRFSKCDVFLSAAAVSDFRPAAVSDGKIHAKRIRLNLVPNPDILLEMGKKKKKNQVLAGFALEDSRAEERAVSKMKRKNCDLMVLNGTETMESDFISASLLYPSGKSEKLGRIRKKDCAKKICHAILRILPGKS